MTGLLDNKASELYNKKFAYAVGAELIGMLLFALLGGSAPVLFAPAANGFLITVIIYITGNISGGHLNPAVTLATLMTGHITICKAMAYIFAQILGSILGVLLQALLVPGVSVGNPSTALGMFLPGPKVTIWQAFGWELILTMILVSTVYAVAIGTPSWGEIGPLAIGLAVFGCATSGGHITGAGMNPARVLAPALVYNSGWSVVFWYVLAEVSGGVLAGLIAWPLYGTGPDYGIWHDIAKQREDLAVIHDKLVEEHEH